MWIHEETERFKKWVIFMALGVLFLFVYQFYGWDEILGLEFRLPYGLWAIIATSLALFYLKRKWKFFRARDEQIFCNLCILTAFLLIGFCICTCARDITMAWMTDKKVPIDKIVVVARLYTDLGLLFGWGGVFFLLILWLAERFRKRSFPTNL